jgi:hypothetical protein
MRTKIQELSGVDLDQAVADAVGVKVGICLGGYLALADSIKHHRYCAKGYSPSTDWAQGGPLLEEYAIGVIAISDAEWAAVEQITHCHGRGPTYLVAAMRCLVASLVAESTPQPADPSAINPLKES